MYMGVQLQRDNLTIPRGHEFGEIAMGGMAVNGPEKRYGRVVSVLTVGPIT